MRVSATKTALADASSSATAGPVTQPRRFEGVARDIGLALLLTLGLALLSGLALRSAAGSSIILPSGGIVAGVLVLLPLRRWWAFVIIGASVQATYYLAVGHVSVTTALLRTTADIVGLICFAAFLRRYRKPKAGLGTDFWLVVPAACVAAAIREIPILIVGFSSSAPEALNQRVVGLEIYVGTVIGILIGSAIVLGLARWREALTARRSTIVANTALLVGIALAVVATFFTSLGADVPGSRYFVLALLLVAAERLPIPLSALLVGLATIGIATAATKGTGAFAREGPATTADVLDAQAYLLVLVVSVFMLAATIDQRRSAQRTTARAAEILQGMFDGSPVASAWVRIAADQRIEVLQANPAFTELLAVPDGSLDGSFLDDVLITEGQRLTATMLVESDIRCQLRDGRDLWLSPSLAEFGATEPDELAAIAREPDNTGTRSDWPSQRAGFTILVLKNVTADHTFAEMTRRHSQRDALTGLPNRSVLLERLDRPVNDKDRSSVGAILLNIDGLRTINDSLGYPFGDQVLVGVARLVEAQAGDALVARIGGDEFVIVKDDVGTAADLEAFARHLQEEIRRPFQIAGQSVVVTASLGIAMSAARHVTEAAVLRWAGAALAEVRAGGRDQVGTFKAGQDAQASIRLALESDLRHALMQRALTCHFQPIVDITTGTVVGAEALVRLRRPDGTVVSPLMFVPLSGELGLLDELTDQVIELACQAAVGWRAEGKNIRISFNAPLRWLSDAATARVASLLSTHGLPGSALTLEVTEDETVDIDGSRLKVLNDLRGMGLLAAIDDFGSGYAGLGSFRAIPADVVKIDRSFIAAMLNSDIDHDFVRSILDLVHHFGKKSVAEGVETPEQYAALEAMGCNYVQGFLISRPVPATEMPTGIVHRTSAAGLVPQSRDGGQVLGSIGRGRRTG